MGGGKDPMIVFRDADLKKAAADAVEFSLMNCGQVCCSVERIYVDKAILPEFEAEVGALAKEWKAGNGNDPDVKIGPLVSAMQKERVASGGGCTRVWSSRRLPCVRAYQWRRPL